MTKSSIDKRIIGIFLLAIIVIVTLSFDMILRQKYKMDWKECAQKTRHDERLYKLGIDDEVLAVLSQKDYQNLKQADHIAVNVINKMNNHDMEGVQLVHIMYITNEDVIREESDPEFGLPNYQNILYFQTDDTISHPGSEGIDLFMTNDTLVGGLQYGNYNKHGKVFYENNGKQYVSKLNSIKTKDIIGENPDLVWNDNEYHIQGTFSYPNKSKSCRGYIAFEQRYYMETEEDSYLVGPSIDISYIHQKNIWGLPIVSAMKWFNNSWFLDNKSDSRFQIFSGTSSFMDGSCIDAKDTLESRNNYTFTELTAGAATDFGELKDVRYFINDDGKPSFTYTANFEGSDFTQTISCGVSNETIEESYILFSNNYYYILAVTKNQTGKEQTTLIAIRGTHSIVNEAVPYRVEIDDNFEYEDGTTPKLFMSDEKGEQHWVKINKNHELEIEK